MKQYRHKETPPALDRERLERLAVAYVGRYATTRAKLQAYLDRKVRERGWEGESDPPIAAIVAHIAELGFVNDAAFALAKADSLRRRGYGARRLIPALRAAGIAESDAGEAQAAARENAWQAALRFAERKRIGPFAPEMTDFSMRSRQFAMMIRAGHPSEIARRLVEAAPGNIPEGDDP